MWEACEHVLAVAAPDVGDLLRDWVALEIYHMQAGHAFPYRHAAWVVEAVETEVQHCDAPAEQQMAHGRH